MRDVGTAGRPTVEILFDENGEPAEAVFEDLAVNPTLFIAASSN